jgi:putative transposase
MDSRLRALLSGIICLIWLERVAGIGLRGLTSVCRLKNQTRNMTSITTFQELLKGLPRGAFDKLVKKHNADKYCKRFGHWDHLIAMLYAQLSGARGLRPLEHGFNSHVSKHYHLGTAPIRRATLADANEKRTDTVFSETAAWLMGQVSRSTRKASEELMFLLDSTSVTLKGREFDRWTTVNRTRNTQGLKLHLLLEAHSAAPAWQRFSPANVNDVSLAPEVPLQRNALYVFDKGYCDYNWWHRIDSAGAYFVTRFKRNAAVNVVEERPIAVGDAQTVLQDQVVRFKSKYPGGGRVNQYGKPLRRVTIVRSDKPTPLILATNDLTSSAAEIAQRYKERWAIELFFKWIKQHLKIKKFLGRTENAVRIQILTALISYLLVALYKQRHGFTQSLWDCLCLIRATLFQRPASEAHRHRRRQVDAQKWAQLQPALF